MTIGYLQWSLERATNSEIWVRQRDSGHIVHFQISADGSELTKQSEIVPMLSSRLDWEGITPAARRRPIHF
jgi:hypothetical protein